MMFRNTTWTGLLVGLLLGLVLAGPVPAQDATNPEVQDDITLLDGLRQRRLFDLARFHLDQRLQDPGLTPASQATLTVELLKTHTQEAAFAPVAERQQRWQEMDRIADSYADTPRAVRVYVVRVQQALAHVVLANLLRQELAAEMSGPKSRDQALLELRQARSILDRLRQDIRNAIPERRSRTLQPGELTADELMALRDNTQYQLALCNLIRSQLYEADDRASRLDALNQVQSQLAEVAATLSSTELLWWKVKLAQCECLRLQGQLEPAFKLLEDLPEDDTPATLRHARRERELELLIAARDDDRLGDLILETTQLPTRPATLDLKLLEGILSVGSRAPDGDTRSTWMENAASMAKYIQVTHGAYWGRRAELDLVNSLGATGRTPSTQPGTTSPPASGEVNLLVRLAAEAVREQRYSEALQTFEQAIAKAEQQRNEFLVFNLHLQAGQMLEKLNRPLDAGQRLTDAATGRVTDSLAPVAHLRGCWNLIRALSQAPQTERPEQQQALVTRLKDHLQRWPDDDSSNQIRIWLADQRRQQGYLQSSINELLQVAPESQYFAQAMSQLSVYGQALPSNLEDRGGDANEGKTRLQAQLRELDRKISASGPAALPLKQCRLNFALLWGPASKRELETQLSSMQNSTDSKMEQWKIVVRLVLDAAGGELPKIERLASLSLDSLDLIHTYSQSLLGRMPQDTTLLELDLNAANRAAQMLKSQGSDSTQSTAWNIRRADLMVKLEQFDSALQLLTELQRAYPKSAVLQVQYARALTAVRGKSDPQPALDQWRRIASKTRPYSDSWLESKLNVARLLSATGDSPAALKVLRYVRATPPGWEGSSYRSEFNDLYRQLQQ